MRCLFEDRLNQKTLVLTHPIERIAVTRQADLADAFTRIVQAQRRGYWIALVLDYSLGHWLEPALHITDNAPADTERLVAWVFEQQAYRTPQSPWADGQSAITGITPLISRQQYDAMIADIQACIGAGEVYQINATFPLSVQTRGDPYDLYLDIAQRHPSRYAAYLEDTHRHILSFSPELFLERSGQRLVTRPMKGTAPRDTTDPTRDQALGAALLASEKNRAENLMIVDLLRNDLGRVSVSGSVTVDPLFELEAYPSVWTMTSTISSELKPNTSLQEILSALFPCGSVTGAPKIAAMQHIARLETYARGVYCGSIGWLAPGGDFSFNVAIRTLVLDQNGHGTYPVGGGIVYDSIAEQEWDECFWKARILGPRSSTRSD
jgi:para-aminobenzoate synthetase component 1